MDKSDELQLPEPMMRAKRELQLGILAAETAVETILDVIAASATSRETPALFLCEPSFPRARAMR